MGCITKSAALKLLKGKRLTSKQKRIRDNITRAYEGKKYTKITAEDIGTIAISNSERLTGLKKGAIVS